MGKFMKTAYYHVPLLTLSRHYFITFLSRSISWVFERLGVWSLKYHRTPSSYFNAEGAILAMRYSFIIMIISPGLILLNTLLGTDNWLLVLVEEKLQWEQAIMQGDRHTVGLLILPR
ncbi:MAG: hypothetical protein ACXWRA_03175 [Pseudobdellovibrionaceae bacterium]